MPSCRQQILFYTDIKLTDRRRFRIIISSLHWMWAAALTGRSYECMDIGYLFSQHVCYYTLNTQW